MSLLFLDAQLLDQRLSIVYIFLENAIAAYDHELVFTAPAVLLYIGFARDQLLFVGLGLILLVWEVSEAPRQVETPVDSPIDDLPSRFGNPLQFDGVFWLVVFRQLDGLSRPTEHTSRVSGIGYYKFLRGNQDHIGSTPCAVANPIIAGVGSLIFFSNQL